ncbi:MAG: metal-dependent transcriptional regulator [Angelakisella sp.]
MRIQESGEMYLETILLLQRRQGQVRSVDVANELGYSKPSVSRAIGILKKSDYLSVDEMGLISLSAEGEAIAVKIYERHDLLSRYLTSLGIDAETAAQDACRIEHVITGETFEKIKEAYMKTSRQTR